MQLRTDERKDVSDNDQVMKEKPEATKGRARRVRKVVYMQNPCRSTAEKEKK